MGTIAATISNVHRNATNPVIDKRNVQRQLVIFYWIEISIISSRSHFRWWIMSMAATAATFISRHPRWCDAMIQCVPSCLYVRIQIVISMPIHIMIRRDVPHCLYRMLFHCKIVQASVSIPDAAKCCQCAPIQGVVQPCQQPPSPPPANNYQPLQLAQRLKQRLSTNWSLAVAAVVVVPRIDKNSKAIHCHGVLNQHVAMIHFYPT